MVQEALISLESRCTGESTSRRIHPLRTRAQRKLRARGNGFSRQIHGGGTAMRMAAGPKGKVGGGRASSSIGRSSRAAGLFPVGGRSGSAAGLLPFGGVSGPRGASLPYQRRQRRTSASSSSMAASGTAQSPPIGGFTSHGGASLIISRCF